MRFFLVIFLCLFAVQVQAAETKRTLWSLYSSKDAEYARYSNGHRFIEMPANHLGYMLEHYDVEKPLPESIPDDVRGIVVWLIPGTHVTRQVAYLDWLEAAVDQGVKLIVIENLGIGEMYLREPRNVDRLNRLLGKLGLQDLRGYQDMTYNAKVLHQDSSMLGFERDLPNSLPSYPTINVVSGIATSHLTVQSSENMDAASDLVITSKRGGYIASGYAVFEGYPLRPVKDIPEEGKELVEQEEGRG